jgi:hypothetical protein
MLRTALARLALAAAGSPPLGLTACGYDGLFPGGYLPGPIPPTTPTSPVPPPPREGPITFRNLSAAARLRRIRLERISDVRPIAYFVDVRAGGEYVKPRLLRDEYEVSAAFDVAVPVFVEPATVEMAYERYDGGWVYPEVSIDGAEADSASVGVRHAGSWTLELADVRTGAVHVFAPAWRAESGAGVVHGIPSGTYVPTLLASGERWRLPPGVSPTVPLVSGSLVELAFVRP